MVPSALNKLCPHGAPACPMLGTSHEVAQQICAAWFCLLACVMNTSSRNIWGMTALFFLFSVQ